MKKKDACYIEKTIRNINCLPTLEKVLMNFEQQCVAQKAFYILSEYLLSFERSTFKLRVLKGGETENLSEMIGLGHGVLSTLLEYFNTS